MKNFLKILGFIGSLIVGTTTVNYLMKSSQADISSPNSGVDTSVQVINQSNNPVKLSRLAKIEQNYQPKPLEEIPVEFVQIATSDRDEGKKLPKVESGMTQSTVRVEQGSSMPFFSSNSALQPIQPERAAYYDDYPYSYYPNDFDRHGDSAPYNGHAGNHVTNNSASKGLDPVKPEKSAEINTNDAAPQVNKEYFNNWDKGINDPEDTKQYAFDPMPSFRTNSAATMKPEQKISSKLAKDSALKSLIKYSALNSLINGLVKSAGAILGNEAIKWLYNKFSNQNQVLENNVKSVIDSTNSEKVESVIDSTDSEKVESVIDSTDDSEEIVWSDVQLISDNNIYQSESISDDAIYQPTSLHPVGHEKSSSNGHQAQQQDNNQTSKNGIKNNVAPTELPNEQYVSGHQNVEKLNKKLSIEPKPQSLQVEEMVSSVNTSNLESNPVVTVKAGITTGLDAQALPETNASVVLIGESVKRPQSLQSIKESILPEEIVELPAVQEIAASAEPEVIDISSTVESQSVWNRVKAYVSSQEFVDGLDKALTTSEGRGLLALGLLTPILATSSVVSSLSPAAVTTAIVPTVAPVVQATTQVVSYSPNTAGMFSALSGANAAMAAKLLLGLAGFAVTKNPMYLLPK